MHDQHPPNLPWLDRLAARLPGYGGYHERGQRRSADQALRDAVAKRLASAKQHIEQAIRQCIDRNALTEVNALERLVRHVERVAQRVRSAGSGTDAFYGAGDLAPAKADPLHAIDLALFDRADALVKRFDAPDATHDRLAEMESDLEELERKLDERALLLQGIH